MKNKTVVSHLLAVSHQPSAISRQLSAISYQLSAISSKKFGIRGLGLGVRLFVLALTFNFLLLTLNCFAQVGINMNGTAADNSAMLDISATGKGLLLPRMTTANRPTNPVDALMIYNTTTNCFEAYYNGNWVAFGCLGCQLPGAFSAISATGFTSNSFSTNWNVSAGATTYFLDVSTNSGFSSYVNGCGGSSCNGFNVGNVSTYSVTGLSCGTYYYRVRANNTCGTNANSNTITAISSAPSITSHPSNSTICSGANTSFTGGATGTSLSYQWQLSINSGSTWNDQGNTGVYSNMTNATMNITTATAGMNNYQYRCVVSGACTPAATCSGATLTLNSAPSISSQPSNQNTSVGGNASFTVGASGTGLTYQWQLSINSGSTWNDQGNGGVYTNMTTVTMNITNATIGMNLYQYRCVVGGTCSPSATSTAATLTTTPTGDVAYTTSGTFSWTCPTGVTSVCVVCVGGGGGNGRGGGSGSSGGSGGGLGWKNNITVTPGNNYTVVVGSGGAGVGGASSGAGGGDSYFINTSTVKGGGGGISSNCTPGGYVGDGGGSGGYSCSGAAGGGGAGGYSGNGGSDNTAGSGGGGGGSAYGSGTVASGQDCSGGGGGTGLYGTGTNGAAGTTGNSSNYGKGGSGGNNGYLGDTSEPRGGNGGSPGGGGGCGGYDNSGTLISYTGGNGATGGVRILWGGGRSFPSNAN